MQSRKLGGIFESEKITEEIAALEERIGEPNFWENDRSYVDESIIRLKKLKKRIEPWQKVLREVTDLKELMTLAEGESEAFLKELGVSLENCRKEFDRLQAREMLGEPHDSAGAFLTAHSGAGGTEACDWAAMLLRMYLRWAERHQFQANVLDLQEAEGGVKSVTVEITGEYAYGYLKCENGIHRLVRISPFDSGARRHTSFASIYASPIIDDTIEIDIQPNEIRVDTYRASGAGGQHVNKTDSAVRITHLATNVVVQCQNERSQHKNRTMAMRMLRSRLYEFYQRQQNEEKQKGAGPKHTISWGNQIRSYVFHPYTMVKDHRTGVERGNVNGVMDGDIDIYIEKFLLHSWHSNDTNK